MNVATTARVSLEEYFRTHFEGECELVNGELRPKPMGTLDHSRLQARLRDLLRPYEDAGKGEAIARDEPSDGATRFSSRISSSANLISSLTSTASSTRPHNSASKSSLPPSHSASCTTNASNTSAGALLRAGSSIR